MAVRSADDVCRYSQQNSKLGQITPFVRKGENVLDPRRCERKSARGQGSAPPSPEATRKARKDLDSEL